MTLRLSELSRPSDAIESHMSSGFLELPHGGKQLGYDAGLRAFALTSVDPQNQNHLLAALPPAELERLAPEMELVPMPLGEILYQPGRQMRHAYFPTTSIVSLHHVMESGASAEAAGVGNEGVVGIPLVMGGDSASSSAVVRTAGHAYRLPSHVFKREFNRGGPLQRLLLRYTQALMSQMIQTAACNRHHTMDQQLCRCLLSALDRAPSGEVVMTHEMAASMLGVRREGVTVVAGKLQRAGLITYFRGRIAVLKRSALEARACECYAVVKKELNRLLTDVRYRQDAPVYFQ
jgi:CRP-like cAMP-binding protein